MHSTKLIGLLALPALSAAAPKLLSRAECHDYVLINTRGTGEPQGTSVGFRAMLEDILTAVPTGFVYDTVYLAAPDVTQLSTLTGSHDIIDFINDGATSCPDQVYGLFGYSQGATVTNQVLQHFDPTSSQGQKIKGVVLAGNPYHLPNKKGNADELCGNSTAGASGVLSPIADYLIPDAWYMTGKVRDICFNDDLVCNGIDVGDLFSLNHLLYGFSETVTSCGANFIILNISD